MHDGDARRAAIHRMATDMAGLPGALMPILHAVLEEFGKHGQLPARVELCGGGSRLPELKEALTESGAPAPASARHPSKTRHVSSKGSDDTLMSASTCRAAVRRSSTSRA